MCPQHSTGRRGARTCALAGSLDAEFATTFFSLISYIFSRLTHVWLPNVTFPVRESHTSSCSLRRSIAFWVPANLCIRGSKLLQRTSSTLCNRREPGRYPPLRLRTYPGAPLESTSLDLARQKPQTGLALLRLSYFWLTLLRAHYRGLSAVMGRLLLRMTLALDEVGQLLLLLFVQSIRLVTIFGSLTLSITSARMETRDRLEGAADEGPAS
jgi:hypothetical protein